MASNSRSGAGSPSHDMPGSSRLYSKRAREIQAQEGIPGLPINPWGGPPTSGNSTPLRENIPESPTDGFPDFAQLPTPDSMPQTRRARAGTVPSRFSPGGPPGGLLNVPSLAVKSARATPSQTPFNKSPSPGLEPPDSSSGGSALLSRLRAGSMPQRSPFSAMPGTTSPFGPSIFSSWNPAGVGRERGSTLASIASVGSNGPSSPSQSHFSKEGGGESDVHMRTLDYLGLAETPQPPRAQLATPYMGNLDYAKQSSRFRSYSVNNKDKYADDEDEYEADGVPMENQYVAALQDQLAATNAAIHNHNLAVQAFASQASATRPRARTAGVLESPGGRLMRTYLTGNTAVSNPIANSAEMRMQDEKDFDDLPQAIAGMSLGRSNSRNAGLLSAEEQGLEGPTSALWLGGIPTSTTTSTLIEMFKAHGPILSARVLTHKNCGFVNFERVESSISAKSNLNGKEIFPGAGPIRINFAKPPSAANTPGHDGVLPSPSPDPFARAQDSVQGAAPANADGPQALALGKTTPTVPPLRDMTTDIVDIVGQFGASEDDKLQTSRSVQSAIQYDTFVEDIPAVREPTHTRVHDAPRLRDIRKRIDNQLLSQAEIEGVAMEMLPEIAELSSDYLGNTVVQKLFEHCTDPVRDAMLAEIAPHMAEIGIHKNGTWAAQKIIDVCKTPGQMSVIVEHLRPYTVPLFLDQYGNYVLQGCLKFGTPHNDFIFETMLSKMWEIAQGRFGARAMRACLESHHASKNQQRMLAAAIALHSVQLATNANGALLLTWFLDTCTFPQRRTVLSPRLVPCLVHLCTHKVAYLTVLKVINQKAEAEARDTILKSLFFTPNDQVLEAILNDNACGSTLIFKVLTTPFFDESIRSQVVDNVKNVLVKIKAQPGQGYKRLMDEVGLSTRTAGPNREANAHPDQRQRPTSRQAGINGQHPQQGHGSKAFFNPLNPTTNATGFDPYNQGIVYGAPTGPVAPAPGYGGYGTPGPAVDQFRQQNMPNGSPIQPPSTQVPQMPGGQAPYGPPGFGLPMGSPYGYSGMGGMQSMGYMQQEQANARRGRR
ncbi:RNA recognition motif domain-containing protein [Hirsutella rhossiliensis]|uniref:RNA recognition motif domain-containing protein n=1 Tax=Hirsutella rhossiliensis TaxID=111463 RepID=A0A9P8MZD5_9HYPO|nr:RNA recognition motif domain-containing protein [Hirsutella rhossiliensis]KAH0963041.1 RNA recognition motif domain-containing protein [Hirsutella rhossiliensis]